MVTYAFDTLEQAEKLQRNGFNELQAKGLVEVIAISTSNSVTKDELHYEVNNLRQEMHLGFAKIENKILSMTISLGAVFIAIFIAALGGYTYLLNWLN